MKYENITKYILREFKIGRTYIGYDYILYGIHLLEIDRDSIHHITKSLYIDIAEKYGTTGKCVERCIRTTIELMWRNKTCNMPLLVEIFGRNYISRRPTNTKFFELLYDYVELCGSDRSNVICPFPECRYCILAKSLGERV